MSDTLDLINTVRLHDNSLSNQNRDLQYDLDRRADRIARKTGNAPLDWDEFSEKFHPQKEMDGLTHATNWGFKGGLLGVVGGIILAGLIRHSDAGWWGNIRRHYRIDFGRTSFIS